MFTWIADNVGTIIICVILAVAVGFIIRKMVKNFKDGNTSCGCGCSGCSMKDNCHSDKKDAK